ncbi:hypothetical protein B5S30_g2655 [[Candida] boidinii]|nr:hypothetical protein B5S30_g2655 [[Candida] boidinii]
MSKKWIDKKSAKTFALVHRAHEDPLYFSEEASDRVFVEIKKNNKTDANIRLETKDELESDLLNKIKEGEIRKNEGEAAIYGITYDDSNYDYMQHLKPIGNSGTTGVFIPAKENEDELKKNRKGEFKLKETQPEGDRKETKKIITDLLPEDMLPSKETVKYDYQRQQNVPDEISGFKPNLDPDLIEALQALEDEDYLDQQYDNDDKDIFEELLSSNKKNNQQEQKDENNEDEWDIDNYEDEYENYDSDNFDWEKDFNKFKKTNDKSQNDWDSDDEFDDDEGEEEEDGDVLGDLPDLSNSNAKSKNLKKKEKRKKGAKTDTSSYSMSSSALCRTEQMTIIDDRFDVTKEKYEQEEQDDYQPFDFNNEREDFAGMIDDFLDNYTLEKGGRRLVRKNEEIEKYRAAADSVSKGKLAAARKKKASAANSTPSSLRGLSNDVKNMKI